MEYERNLDYFNRRQIIYRRDPVNDKPTETHSWGYYYESGTYECYTLFNSRAKINTYKSLRWHLYVLWYLNPKVDPDEFLGMCKYICHKPNGFVTFTISESAMQNINYEVSMSDLERQPPNKLRKVIFKDYSMLTISEKLSIVGKLIGRSSRVDEEAIYQCMLDLNDLGKHICIGRIAGLLDVSKRTIYRHINDELKQEIKILNEEI